MVGIVEKQFTIRGRVVLPHLPLFQDFSALSIALVVNEATLLLLLEMSI